MDRDRTSGGMDEDEKEFAEENMDRAAQSGLEGAFDADPGMDPERRQLRQDAEDAFGGSGGTQGSGSGSATDTGTMRSAGAAGGSSGGMGGSSMGGAGATGGSMSGAPSSAGGSQSTYGDMSQTGPLGGAESITGGLSSGGSMGGAARSGPMGQGSDYQTNTPGVPSTDQYGDAGTGAGRTNLDSDLGPTSSEGGTSTGNRADDTTQQRGSGI